VGKPSAANISDTVADDVVKMLVGHSDASVHGQTYLHRNLIPLSLLREGLEMLRYDQVVEALL
jgi:hypothetical protein